MASSRLPVGHISGKKASSGYTCIEKYEWQRLTHLQSKERTQEQFHHHVATPNCPLHVSSRLEDSEIAGKISHPFRGCFDDIHSTRGCSLPMRGIKRRASNSRMGEYTSSFDDGHSFETRGPENGVGGPHRLSHSYSRHHVQDDTCPGHSTKQTRHIISPGAGPIRHTWTERSPPFDHVCCCAKGADGQMCEAANFGKNFPVNQGSSCQNGNHHKDRYLPIKDDFSNGQFSRIDAAKHRCYMQGFHSSDKHVGNSWKDPIFISDGSLNQSHESDEIVRAHPKSPVDQFQTIHHEQLELSRSKEFHGHLDNSRYFKNAYSDKMIKGKKQGFRENTYDGVSFSKYGRNSSQRRNVDHFSGKKGRKNAYEDKSKRIDCPSEQSRYLQVEPDQRRKDIQEGNAETTKYAGQMGAEGSCNSKKSALMAPASSSSTNCDENRKVSNSKYSSKTICSKRPKLTEGLNKMVLDSDKQSILDGCTKRGILQHLAVTHMEKGLSLKESDNVSVSKMRRDCLKIWRTRRLREDSVAGADKIVKADQQQTAQTSQMSIGRRVRNRRPISCVSSESDVKDNSASESSDQCSNAMSLEGHNCGEERADKKMERTPSYPSSRECNKSPQNTFAEKGLMYTNSMELPPDASPVEITLPREREKLICHQLPTDSKVQSSSNGCSAVVAHHDSCTRQNVTQQEANSSDERRKDKIGVKCESAKETSGGGAELAEKAISLCVVPALLDEKIVGSCSMHENLKANASKLPNPDSGTATFDGSLLDRGAVNKCQKSVARSCESYRREFERWIYERGCTDIQREAMNCDILLRKKQECLELVDCENKVNQRATMENFHVPQTLGIAVSLNQQISGHCASNTTNSGAARQGHLIPCSSIPDLNCVPSMIADEDSVPSEEPVSQVATEGSKTQCVCLPASLTEPSIEEKQFTLGKPNQRIREDCEKGICKAANQLQLSDSNTGPPQPSTVEENSTSDSFKLALCEFIKNILKPLCEDGLLTREVHKIIVKKAVEKVAGTWGTRAPATEVAICRVLSDESQNLEKLVKGYLELYVGKGVLKNYA